MAESENSTSHLKCHPELPQPYGAGQRAAGDSGCAMPAQPHTTLRVLVLPPGLHRQASLHSDGHEGSFHATSFYASLNKEIAALVIPTWCPWPEPQNYCQAHGGSKDEQCHSRDADAPLCAACAGTAWPAAACWEARARGEGLGLGPTGSLGIAQSYEGGVSGFWQGLLGFRG